MEGSGFFVVWFLNMVALYFVIKWAIDNSKAAEDLKDIKRRMEEHFEKDLQ